MKKWFSRELDTARLSLLAFLLSMLCLLISNKALSSPHAGSPVGSWSRLGDLSRCVDEPVRLTGTVLNITERESVTKLRILPFAASVNVVAFPRTQLNISEGDVVQVDGRVQEFRSNTEVIADALKVS